MNWIGDVFYRRVKGAAHKPPTWAALFWGAWSVVAGVAFVVTVWDHLTLWLAPLSWALTITFLAVELPAVFTRAAGGTLSEFLWWYNRRVFLRAAFAFALAGTFAVHIHPAVGIVLLIWLSPHLVMRGEDR